MTVEQTFIEGKDAALETSIENFQQKLAQLGFDIEEASWLNPVPNVWSVHIRDKSCPQCFSNGKGATKKAALASALGEFLERLSTNYFFADYYLGAANANAPFVHYPNERWFAIEDEDILPAGLLDKTLHRHYDPNNELTADMLIDLQSGNRERGIVALPYVRQSDKKAVYIPQAIIANLYVSNGMSAGNTMYEARVQAMSEIFERAVKNRIIAEAISLPPIPEKVIAQYPEIAQAIQALEKAGFPIFAYDASLGGQYPVICVVLLDSKSGGCYASFGAHPSFKVAFERTVTELLQGRSLNDLNEFLAPTFDNDEVAEHTNLETHFIDSSGLISWDFFQARSDYNFVHWDFSGTTEQEFNKLMAIFRREEREVYIMDYDHLGVNACRIIVPGMSEIYPVDDLVYDNNNSGAIWRKALLSLPLFNRPKSEYEILLNLLDDEGVDDNTRVREFIGIVPPKGSGWVTLRVGELKSMLALASHDWETALAWAEWTLEMNASVFSQARLTYYRALVSILTLHLDETRQAKLYRPVFERLYGAEIVAVAWNAVANEGNPFFGLPASDESFCGFYEHQQLLDAYAKLQRAKKRWFEE